MGSDALDDTGRLRIHKLRKAIDPCLAQKQAIEIERDSYERERIRSAGYFVTRLYAAFERPLHWTIDGRGLRGDVKVTDHSVLLVRNAEIGVMARHDELMAESLARHKEPRVEGLGAARQMYVIFVLRITSHGRDIMYRLGGVFPFDSRTHRNLEIFGNVSRRVVGHRDHDSLHCSSGW
jgi:hypothetical protein